MANGHIFILGGARSGKTALAEVLALRLGRHPAYLATAEGRDAEMTARIAAHRAQRAGRFATIEAPLAVPAALAAAARRHDVILLDCLTLWLSNLMATGSDIAAATASLVATLSGIEGARVIIVANEVGQGIVPDNELARAFRDEAGWMNQAVAGAATNAYFVVAGLPLVLKGVAPDRL